MGKNAGDDLAEGKLTLPLIYTLRHGSSNDQRIVRDAIETRSSAALADVIVAVKRCGALDRTRHDAEMHAQGAMQLLAMLPNSEYRDALAELARFCVLRLN